MPGAMSDKDREFLVSMVPGIATTSQGRAQMIATMKKLDERNQEVAQMARDYRREKGKLDEGFFDLLRAHSDANPLFEGVQAPQASPASSPENPYSKMSDDEVLQELRRKGLLK
jgi:hypothetical protein